MIYVVDILPRQRRRDASFIIFTMPLRHYDIICALLLMPLFSPAAFDATALTLRRGTIRFRHIDDAVDTPLCYDAMPSATPMPAVLLCIHAMLCTAR